MIIEFKDADEFELLLDNLLKETVNSSIYYALYKNILGQIPSYKKVFIESNTFWSLTTNALLDSTIMRLCRVYDSHIKSLSILNFLDTIEANSEVFDLANFKMRLKDNPFVESLSETARKPDINQLLAEKLLVNAEDPLVKKLLIWRNNLIAHRRASTIIKQIDVSKEYLISQGELKTLIERATSIVNRYSALFRASTYSTKVVGDDDYKYIFDAVNEKLKRDYELND